MSWLPGLLAGGLALAGLVGLAGAVCRLRRRLLVVTIIGHSMLPTYGEGDRVLVRRDHSVRTGDVIVADVEPPAGRVVKRVAAIAGDPVPDAIGGTDALVPAGMLVLLGDNTTASTDSRHYGYVEAGRVVGVVVRRVG